ncbi:MAG: ABC transporter ATP-binding protein [Acidimicrobiales bacterium]|nr:ABC transporter ATP-binding protein [Acidimicrobiales bacterium]
MTKRWGDFTAVDDLTLSVEAGECYAFLGRNGAGKSTTARMFLDFLHPTSGSVTVLGGSGRDPEVRKRIGYLPGDLNLPRTMTGLEAVEYFGSVGASPDRAEVQGLIDRLGMNTERRFHEMSTGNRRKVGLVLAFMNDPDLLVLDEPTSGLDPVLQDTFRELVRERLDRGTTIWLTSHVMSDLEDVADRVGLIDRGRLVQDLSMDDLRRQASDRLTFTFPAPPPADAFDGVGGVLAATVSGSEVSLHVDGAVTAVLARAAELGAVGIRTTQRDLEDIFLETYGTQQGR